MPSVVRHVSTNCQGTTCDEDHTRPGNGRIEPILERAAEERRGIIRYLRPEFQNPTGARQTLLVVDDDGEPQVAASEGSGKKKRGKELTEPVAPQQKVPKRSWPKSLSEQASAVQSVLAEFSAGASATDVARCFGRATRQRVELVEDLLETLAALGKARELAGGRFVEV